METQLRLVDGARELELWRLEPLRDDVIIDELDISSPAIREVVEDRPGVDGTDDLTALHGAAAVSLKLWLCDRPQALLAQIMPFMRPGRRPWLCLTDDEWPGERRIRLRADQWSPPRPHVGLGRWLEVQLQWKAPDGVWVASDPVTFQVDAATGSSAGLSWPNSWPWTFPGTSPVGSAAHTNPGDGPADQVVRLYGPCNGPRWTCDTTGETLAFRDTLVLGAGEFVEIDTRAHTANAMGQPDASRLPHLDYAASTWWQIPDGPSTLRYHPVSGVQAGCAALGSYRPEWLAS